MIHFDDRQRLRYRCHPSYDSYVRHYYVRETLVLDDSNIAQNQRLIDGKTMAMNAYIPSDFSIDYQLACGNGITQLLQPAALPSPSIDLTNYFARLATLEKPSITEQPQQPQQPQTIQQPQQPLTTE